MNSAKFQSRAQKLAESLGAEYGVDDSGEFVRLGTRQVRPAHQAPGGSWVAECPECQLVLYGLPNSGALAELTQSQLAGPRNTGPTDRGWAEWRAARVARGLTNCAH